MLKTVVMAAVIVVVIPFAHAEDKWSETVTFSRSDQSTMKIVEPEGYKVSVTIDGNNVTDTVPAAIKMPQTDGFYMVTLTAPNGAQWAKKIEVKRYQVTELRVSHAAGDKPAAAPAAQARKFIGNVRNKVATCGKKLAARVDFIDASGAGVASIQVKSAAFEQTTLQPGSYDIRAYVWDQGANDWTYQTTGKAQISADGWSTTLECGKGPLEIHFAQP